MTDGVHSCMNIIIKFSQMTAGTSSSQRITKHLPVVPKTCFHKYVLEIIVFVVPVDVV